MYQLLIISFSRNISFVFNSLLFNLVATLLRKEYDSRPRVFPVEMGSQPNYSWLASLRSYPRRLLHVTFSPLPLVDAKGVSRHLSGLSAD